MYNEFERYGDCNEWDSWDEVVYDSTRDMQKEVDILNCLAYYGKRSHISINGGQPQPLDDELFQPADLLELFHDVSVIHMTEHIEDAIDTMRDASIGLGGDLRAVEDSVVCGRLKIQFPAIEWDDVLHYLESVK